VSARTVSAETGAPRRARRAGLQAAKYLAVARVSLATGIAYRGDYLMQSSFLIVVMFVFMVLWRTTYAATGQEVIDGFALRDMIWYLAITEAVMNSRPRLAGRIDAMIVRCGRGQPFHQAPEVLGEADRWSASIT